MVRIFTPYDITVSHESVIYKSDGEESSRRLSECCHRKYGFWQEIKEGQWKKGNLVTDVKKSRNK